MSNLELLIKGFVPENKTAEEVYEDALCDARANAVLNGTPNEVVEGSEWTRAFSNYYANN